MTDELKKEAEECMHNALFWLKLPISKENVEQGGSYILKLLEPREKRIAELEKKITSLEGQKSLHEGILWNDLHKLEKENAELRNERNAFKIYSDGAELDAINLNEQLTKAKNLLAKWVELFKPKGGNIPPTSIQVETEQFLKGDGCSDCFCEDCTKEDCGIKKLGLVEVKK